MPEVKRRQRSKRASGAQINGNSNGSSTIKIDTPEEIKEEESRVLEIKLINKDLTSVSGNLFLRHCNLQKLDLSENRLSSLPTAIKCLVNLESLALDKNKFSEFPQVLEELSGLKELSLKENKLTNFPENSNGLLALEKLNFSGNAIKFLPVSWKKMARIKSLDLSDNFLKFIPSCIEQGMPILEMLDLSDNKMEMDGEIYSHRIKKFYGKNNNSSRLRFPKWIFSGKYYKFEELNFENSIFDLIMIPLNPKIRVKVLNLQRCNLTSKNIAAILADIESVETLKIGNNFYSYEGNLFTELPLEIVNSPQDLLELHCQAAGLPNVSPAIRNFINVTMIDFSRNHISWLPDEFAGLKKLEVLSLAQNTLIMLPRNIGKLERLRVLDVASNHISSLPESMRELTGLQYLDLYHNDLRELPEYFREFQNLIGFDVEHNIIDTEICKLLPYCKLRESLRTQNKSEFKLNGPKEEPMSNSARSSSSYSSSSSTSDISAPTSPVYSLKNEDWDKEYDSSDDFDGYNPSPIIEKNCYQTRYTFGNPMFFCPADLHLPRVREIIAEKYNSGKYSPWPAIVEGQFDDVE